MLRIQPLIPFGLVLLLAACQTTPPTQPSPTDQLSPAPVPSGAAPVASSDAGTASAAPTVKPLVQVSGKVYDDAGRLLPGAMVELKSADGAIARTVEAVGGAYVVSGVPVGTLVTARATMAGYTTREQALTLREPRVEDDVDPNVMDFGGSKAGAYLALSLYPEIIGVTPFNRQTGVSGQPLVVTMRLSHPLDVVEQARFGRILQLRFQVPTDVAPSGELVLRSGVAYDDDVAGLTWNAAGDEVTFRFGAPIVTRSAAASSVTVGFDQQAEKDIWPKATNGKALGREPVLGTSTGNGVTVDRQVAPFWNGTAGLVAPSVRPSPAVIWAKTHVTTSSFSLAPENQPLKVKQVLAYRGGDGGVDQMHVIFDRPVRGYPESALDGSAIRASNYRYVLGKTEKADDAKRFEESNPAASGASIGLEPYYSRSRNDMVILPFRTGAMDDYTHFKLYVDPGVKDIAGNGVQTSAQDPITSVADHVIQGKIN